MEAITQSEWWHTIKGGRHHRAGSVIIGAAGIVFFLNLEIWYLATTHGGKNTWWMIKYPHIKKNAQQKYRPAIQVWLCVSYDQMNGVHCHVVSVWLVTAFVLCFHAEFIYV